MKKNVIIAKIMEKVARTSIRVAADSRCMYCLHQPKQPSGIKDFSKTSRSSLGKIENQV